MRKFFEASVNLLPYGIRPRIKQLPGIAALQRWLVSSVLSTRPFVHTINGGPATGLRFEVTLPLDKAVWAGTYEPEFTAAIVQGVKHGDICYDIGGYRGYMSGAMALAGASRVLVFEPLPTNQRALRRLCDLNRDLPIELVPAAVGNADGLARLKVMADTSMGKLINSPFQAAAASLAEIEVPIRRIDTLFEKREFPPPNVMKIDVEGAELDVLCGAACVLRTFRPLIFLEAHSAALEHACLQELLQVGYKIHRLESELIGDEHTRHLVCRPG